MQSTAALSALCCRAWDMAGHSSVLVPGLASFIGIIFRTENLGKQIILELCCYDVDFA